MISDQYNTNDLSIGLKIVAVCDLMPCFLFDFNVLSNLIR